MNRFWKYIPPLASDYSGVCSVLFNMDSLNILYSPGGCVHSITEVDECRNLLDTGLYYTKWNDVDVVQGAENKLLNDLKRVDISRCDFIALIGTPIPNLIGVNLKSCARKIAKELQKPVLAFETNGFESYPSGIADCYLKLAQASIRLSGEACSEKQINLLGYSPFVLGEDRHLRALLAYFTGSNLRINVLGCRQGVFQNASISSKAGLNLVIAEEGVKLAEHLKEQYAIPYIVKLPIGITEMEHYISIIEAELNITLPAKTTLKKESSSLKTNRDGIHQKVLIIGEPFVSLALKACLAADFGMEQVSVVSLLKTDRKSQSIFPESRYGQVQFAASQDEIMERADGADIIIADPLLIRAIPKKPSRAFIPLPYLGLSGREFAHLDYDYIGIEGFKYFNKYLNT